MFEKIARAAERLAAGVGESRRGFLARLGKRALAAAGAVGALLALPRETQAGTRVGVCQIYSIRGGGFICTGTCFNATAAGYSAWCRTGSCYMNKVCTF